MKAVVSVRRRFVGGETQLDMPQATLVHMALLGGCQWKMGHGAGRKVEAWPGNVKVWPWRVTMHSMTWRVASTPCHVVQYACAFVRTASMAEAKKKKGQRGKEGVSQHDVAERPHSPALHFPTCGANSESGSMIVETHPRAHGEWHGSGFFWLHRAAPRYRLRASLPSGGETCGCSISQQS